MEKLSHFEWKMDIHAKIFAIAFLSSYIADHQGHDLQEKIHN